MASPSTIVNETLFFCTFVVLFMLALESSVTAALTAPTIVQHPQDNTPAEGNSEILSCSAYGSAPLEYRWKKDDIFITSYSTNGFHPISSVQKSDSGSYQCIVRNEVGSVISKPAQIQVAYIENFQGSATQEIVQQGQAIQLSCPPIESVPEPLITWKKNGLVVSGITNQIKTLDNRLVILSASNSDVGQYSCQALNPKTAQFKDSPAITLRVEGNVPSSVAPSIIVTPQHTSVKRDDPVVKLQCIANAKPLTSMTITWRHNGQLKSGNTPEYAILNPTTAEEGVYECEVRLIGYSYGPVKATANITMHTSPQFIITPSAVVLGEVGFVSEIQCQAVGVPAPTYTWYKDAIKVSTIAEDRYRVLNTGSIQISNVKTEDEGMFQCLASNDVGHQIAHTWFQVQSMPPSITQPPNNTFVIDSLPARMICRTTGAPQPDIVWKRGETIIASENNRINDRFALSDNGDLLITPAIQEDTGLYTCMAINPIGTANASATLTVQIRTRISVYPQDTSVIKARTATFKCEVVHDANVAVRIVWYKNGVEIELEGTRRISMLPDGSLKITGARSDDIGNYTCNVTSSGGNDDRTARLEVIELPYAPGYVQARLSETQARTIDVVWSPSYNGNQPLIRFIVQMKENNKDWQVVLSNVGPVSPSVSIPNLTPAWTYAFKVCAVNGVGEGPYSLPSSNVTLPEEPPDAAPQGVVASPRSKSSIMMQWQPPPEEKLNGVLLGYRIQFKLTGYTMAFYDEHDITNPDQLSYELAELITWSSYTIRIAAYNSEGPGVYSAEIEVRTAEGVPTQAPRSFSSHAVNSTSVKYIWTPPEAQFIFGVNQGYKMMAWEDSNPDFKFAVTIAPNPLEPIQEGYVTGLKKYTRYFTSVLCYTRAGDGPDSDPNPVVTFQDIPGPVGDLSFSEIYDSSLKVSWSPPEEKNGILESYFVGVQEYNNSATFRDNEVAPDKVSYTVTGLTALTTYEIMVWAKTQYGPGPKVTSTISSGVPPELPTKPINLAVSNVQAYSVMLQYTPGYDGKTSINTWKVEAQINGATQWENIYNHHDPDAYAFEIPQLKPFSKYRFRLTAINVVGASYPSEPSREIETQQDVPATPPESVIVRAASETSLTVRWIPLATDQWNGRPLGYRVAWRHTSSVHKRAANSFQYADIDDHIGGTYTIEDLGEWTEYEVKVRAYNEKGNGPYSEVTKEKTRDSVPSAGPANVTAEALDSTTIHVTWDDVPLSDQNGKLLGYKVLYCESLSDICESIDLNDNSSRSADLTELRKYVQYDIQILAYTRIGNGELSKPPVRVRTEGDVPGPVTGILFPTVTYTSLTVLWEEPTEPNGVITGYRVTYRKNTETRILASEDLSATEYNLHVSGLAPDTYYLFTITALSGLGWGEPTQALVLTVTTRNTPQAPTDLLVPQVDVNSRNVTLIWVWKVENNGNSPIRRYTVQYKQFGQSWVTHSSNVPVTATSYLIDKLRPYMVYQFRIRAHNDVGASPYSLPTPSVTTLQDYPDEAPTITQVIPYTASSVHVYWQPPPQDNLNGIFRGYKIQYRQLTDSSYMEHVIENQGTGQFELKDLTMFAWYEIVMRIVNRIGDGPASPPETIYAGEAVPTAPPRSVSASVQGPTQIKVMWEQPSEESQNGGLQGYKIYYWVFGDNNGLEKMQSVTKAETKEVMLDRLDSYTTYEMQVLCFNAAGDGPRSTPPLRARTDQTVPGAPGALVFTKITMNAVNVTWTIPQRPNGELLGYQVIYQPLEPIEGTSKIITVDIDGGKRTYLWATELAERKWYIFSVSAKTKEGYGPERRGNVTTGPQPGAPSAPRSLRMRSTDSAVIISWTVPNDTGASPLIGYVIEGYPTPNDGREGMETWEEVAGGISPQATTYTISYRNLRANHRYRFRVMAVNSHSYSLPSAESPVSDSIKYYSPIYEEHWFLIVIAAVGLLVILMLVILLCVLGRNRRYRGKRRKGNNLHGEVNATVEHDDGGFGTFELNARRSMKKDSTYAKPPRPSPASIAYSDEEPTKYDDQDSSSLTEKPSSLGDSTESDASESEAESDVKDPHSFVNHYANDPMRQSWKRQRPTKAYSYTDSEPDVYSNGAVTISNGMLHMQAGSRAPLPGFSSFV
ncbi:protein sidekick-2-like [Glandiceps talaboti]